jgi:dipeptide transport system substrate-binding protein
MSLHARPIGLLTGRWLNWARLTGGWLTGAWLTGARLTATGLVAAGLVAAGLAASLPSAAALAAEPEGAQTFIYCSEGSPEGFNPQLYTAGTTFDASSNAIFNRLVEFERGTTHIRPGLAERWEVSPDGLVYTFHLRRGVSFHGTPTFTPSRPFNADDVLYSFLRQWDPEHPDHTLSGGTYEYFNSMGLPDLLAGIEKVDEHTVRFTLKRPDAPFLANLAMPFASILSAEYADAMRARGTPEQIDLQPIGTGPFRLTLYRKDDLIRYAAHDGYWAGRPAIDRLIFDITTDAAVAYAKLRRGECHLVPYPNRADMPAMRADRTLRVLEREGLNVAYLAFNTEKPPFDDVRVRRALNLAVNKDAIIDAVYLGGGTKAKNPIPPTMWSYNEAVEDYGYDPEAARALLAEAGLGNGFTTDLWAMPVKRPHNPNARRMAEMIQADWKAVGVDAKIVTYEWGEYLRRSKFGEHETLILGWTGDNGDPDNFLTVLLGCEAARDGANRARWCLPAFEAAIDEARRTTDTERRTRLYERAQTLFKAEAPWVPIAHSIEAKAMRAEVEGFVIDPFGGHYFDTVRLKP